ncbi:hypothetical protein [Lacihabitans soyangensis]|uniref:Ig-like domain-containing protein n=1 Tax=Lacihabitans soyangensis TaxID=869394 RepID=A0AAE3KSL1_9BACT|nr:hypothetical protein [Lacihabitans soyangensis]MCP9762699.1 hypothetical protein [Lacihabitans soyangensis]
MKKIPFTVISTILNFVFTKFPNLVASRNAPVCNGNTLSLSLTHDSPTLGTTVQYSWSELNNFTSTAQKPQRFSSYAFDDTHRATLTLSGTQTAAFTATTTVLKTPVSFVALKCCLQDYHLNIINDFCAGNSMSLEVQTDYTSGVNYSWTGPYGFTRSERVPKISNISATNEGCIELDSNLLNRLYSHRNNNLPKVFHESYGVSPSEYREQVTKK